MKVNNNTVVFAKTKQGAIIPSKRLEDAGYDVYACFDEDYVIIKPHETKMIPTGLASAISTDYVIILKERGSTGTKGLAQRCGVIDSGFRSEWFVPLTNVTSNTIVISKLPKEELPLMLQEGIVYPYSKAIAQALIVPVPVLDVQEVDYATLQAFESERGSGALGSSNK